MRLVGLLLVVVLAGCGGDTSSVRGCYEFRQVAGEYADDGLRGPQLKARLGEVTEKAQGSPVADEAEQLERAAGNAGFAAAVEAMDDACAAEGE